MTDKERLGTLKKNREWTEATGGKFYTVDSDDYKWLIKQAERVQELESDSYNAHLERLLDRKEQEIERYREAIEKIKLNVKICGNEEYFPKVVEEIVNEALEGEE